MKDNLNKLENGNQFGERNFDDYRAMLMVASYYEILAYISMVVTALSAVVSLLLLFNTDYLSISIFTTLIVAISGIFTSIFLKSISDSFKLAVNIATDLKYLLFTTQDLVQINIENLKQNK